MKRLRTGIGWKARIGTGRTSRIGLYTERGKMNPAAPASLVYYENPEKKMRGYWLDICIIKR
jgi:hypothetical protein